MSSGDLTPYGPRDLVRTEPVPTAAMELARYQEESHRPDLRSVWSFARRNWWILALGLFLGVTTALAYNHYTRPVYESRATVELDSTTAVPAAFTMVPTTSPIATDMLILVSRRLSAAVVDTLRLQVQVAEPKAVPRDTLFSRIEVARDARPGRYVLVRREGGSFELRGRDGERIQDVVPGTPFAVPGATLALAPGARRHEKIAFTVSDFERSVSRVVRGILVRVPGKDPRAEVLEITYNDSDRHLAAMVPNALLDEYIEHRRSKQKQASNSTVAFLRAQLDTLNMQLREAELNLRRYREATSVIDLASETAARISEQAVLQGERDRLVMERNAILNVRSQMARRDSMDPMEPSPYRRLVAFPLLGAVLSTPLADVATLESQRNSLLARRTVNDPDVQVLTEQIRTLEGELENQTDVYLATLESQLAALTPVAERSGAALSEIPRKEFELTGLQRQTTILATTVGILQTSLKEAEITKAVDDPGARVIDRALVPRNPIRPRRSWNLMLGVFLGLAAGVGVAYSRELLDTRIHTREDLRDLTGVPVLGLIPRMADMPTSLATSAQRLSRFADRKGRLTNGSEYTPRLVAESDRSSAVSEAFRSLRTNITFSSTPERASKVFVLTSPTPQDGKTTTAANLAVTFAQQGLRVVLIDADMRRGVIHKLFRLPRTPGLSNILVENVELEQAMHRVQLEQGAELDMLPTGTVPPNPAELLSSPRMQWLVARMEERYDAVVFDTPPLTLVTDAAILASHAHTVLLVARANKTEQGAIHFAIEQLRNVGAPVRGSILNDVDYRRDGYSGKYSYTPYSTSYGPRSEG